MMKQYNIGMRFLRAVLAVLPLLAAGTSCNVHELYEASVQQPVTLKLTFATDFTCRAYACEEAELTELGSEPETGAVPDHGYIHYTVRIYPGGGSAAQRDNFEEITFTREIASGYDCDYPLSLAPGRYTLCVWSALTSEADDEPFYNAEDFSEITLQGDHAGSNAFRDAFRGTTTLALDARSNGTVATVCRVQMERPLAKYEFVATDAARFLEQHTSGGNTVSLSDYYALFRYTEFMPCAYNIFSNKPVDSSTGVSFTSEVLPLGTDEASLGFDYVFVNGTESVVKVQVELRRKSDGALAARTPVIRVPLRRNEHTVLRGEFISDTSAGSASGGVGIDPGFDDDIDIEIPF